VINIECPVSDGRVYYSLDGSKPTANSTLYTSPFTIRGSKQVRAVLYRGNSNIPVCLTSAYFEINAVLAQTGYYEYHHAPYDYSVDRALDGVTYMDSSWVSKPYGGENLRDVWFTAVLPRTCELKGIYLIGCYAKWSPTIEKFDVFTRQNKEWVLSGKGKKADVSTGTRNHIRVYFDDIVKTDAVRLLFNRDSLPSLDIKKPGGHVRIVELMFILKDGTEVMYGQL